MVLAGGSGYVAEDINCAPAMCRGDAGVCVAFEYGGKEIAVFFALRAPGCGNIV